MFFLKTITYFLCCLLVCISFSVSSSIQDNSSLRERLPPHILASNKIYVVNDGHMPPYVIENDLGKLEGASIDLLYAIADLLQVDIEHQSVVGLYPLLRGVTSGQYDMAIGPIADISKRQQNADFIDYATSYLALLVRKGNPLSIISLSDMCGKRIANTLGSSGEERLKSLSRQCQEQKKLPIKIMSFRDHTTAILSVELMISDAYFGGIAMLSYYAMEKKGLELTAFRKNRTTPERYYAAMVAKDSPLGPVLLAALQQLSENGTYQAIMKKWGLESSMINEIGMNLAQ